MNTIAITGASGFIGKYLVRELVRRGGYRIKILTRSRHADRQFGTFGPDVEIVEGDLRQPETLQGFLEAGCTLINLVYLWGGGEAQNLAATRNLLTACKSAQIARLIHCSTADVAGRTSDNPVNEKSECKPITEYAIIKRKVELTLLEAAKTGYDTIVLRPTAVFGPGGKNLEKLAGDLLTGSRLHNYLKSSLFGQRRMNLTHVENVTAALLFLAQYSDKLDKQVFIISNDDCPANNLFDVERTLMRELGVPDYVFPRLPVPPAVLSFLLLCLGKNNVNPRCDYHPGKLIRLGFIHPMPFETGLVQYAAWYRSVHRSKLNATT